MSQSVGLLVGLAIALWPFEIQGSNESLSRTRYLMGTTCTIESDTSSSGIEAAFSEIDRIEGFLSTWRGDTELSSLNRSAGGAARRVSSELFGLLESTLAWSRKTHGSFTPLVGPLINLWNARETGAFPTDAEIDHAVASVRIENVQVLRQATSIRLTPGARFEEGGFGKGYAIDRALDELVVAGCGDCTIDFGGQIAVRATSPRELFVANPAFRGEPALSIHIRRGSVATTSGSEKWFSTPSGRLSHVIDPRSGRALPPRGSSTVVHSSAFVADILSTALYVMGPEEGLEWANENEVTAIFIVPSDSGWSVVASEKAQNPGLGLKSLSADFRLKGNTE